MKSGSDVVLIPLDIRYVCVCVCLHNCMCVCLCMCAHAYVHEGLSVDEYELGRMYFLLAQTLALQGP